MRKGDRIRQLREEKGITQEELGKLLSTTRQTISKYEKGVVTNIPSDRVEALARILDTTPEYILGWDSSTIEKDADILADVFVRMRADVEFCELVKYLYDYDSTKIRGISQMLHAFDEQPADKFKQ